jgi:hypothetical protein
MAKVAGEVDRRETPGPQRVARMWSFSASAFSASAITSNLAMFSWAHSLSDGLGLGTGELFDTFRGRLRKYASHECVCSRQQRQD